MRAFILQTHLPLQTLEDERQRSVIGLRGLLAESILNLAEIEPKHFFILLEMSNRVRIFVLI